MSRDRLCLSRAQSELVEVTIDVVFSRRKRFISGDLVLHMRPMQVPKFEKLVPLFLHGVVSRACLGSFEPFPDDTRPSVLPACLFRQAEAPCTLESWHHL